MSPVRWIAAVVVLIAGSLALMFFGLEPVFALGGGVLAASVVLLATLRGEEAVVEDGPREDAPDAGRGSEISRLAWAFNPRTGVAGEIVGRRVRGVLRRRLARHGIDVDDPADVGRIDTALGAGLWQRLNARQVQSADIRRALDAADRLAPASDARPADGRTPDVRPARNTTEPPRTEEESA